MQILIGDYVVIEKNSIVSAKKIGSNVYIGKNCIIVLNFNYLVIKIFIFKVP